MAKLATCPGCTTQLALPEDATLSDRARCPRCHEEFMLMETVQFSIPTAEILSFPEPKTLSSSDSISPNPYVPTSDPYLSTDSDDSPSATSYQSSAELFGSTSESEPTPEPLPPSATLSDWEARLKRAIAGNLDDQPATNTTLEFSNPSLLETNPEEPVTYEPQDFLVDDDDLVPAAASQEKWSTRDSFEEEDVPSVNFANDQTSSEDFNVPQFSDDQEIPPAIREDYAASRQKRKRSPWRTLVSASLGVVGIPLGLYALLWLRGPAGDMLHIAQYLPSFMLPAEFQEPDFDGSHELLVEESTAKTNDSNESADTLPGLTDNEPQPEEVVDAEPLIREDTAVAPASAVLPTYQGPTFELVDSAEFGELLAIAQQAAPQLSTGDLKSKESVASKGQAYMALARLADKGAFLNQPGHSSADTARAQAAEQLLESTLRDEIVQRDLPQIALRWWQYPQRPSPGIVLVGEVKRVQANDAGTLVFISLGDDPVAPEIPVLVSRANYHEGETIGIAGSIEPHPQDRLPAIDSSLGPIVIAHTSVTLDSPPAELTP
jgi:hypothetical protein